MLNIFLLEELNYGKMEELSMLRKQQPNIPSFHHSIKE
jgi:hypothetical protein